MAEMNKKENPKALDAKKAESETGRECRGYREPAADLLKPICDSRYNKSGNQTHHGAQPEQNSNLLWCHPSCFKKARPKVRRYAKRTVDQYIKEGERP